MKYFGLFTAFLLAANADAQIHHLKTVFVIVMENHNWSQIKGSASAPYINHTLLPMGSHAEQYYNPHAVHPSLPNYLWLEGGTSFGVHDDLPPSAHSQATTSHLVTLLRNKGVPWKSYQQGISGTGCPLTDQGTYHPKHNPFVYFNDVTNGLNPKWTFCQEHVRPLSELHSDLAHGAVSGYVFITPDLCHDMHDPCAPAYNSIKQGDDWLKATLPAIFASEAYQTGAVLITWEEGSGGDGPIGMIVLSPYAKGHGYHNSIHYTHGSTLRTLQEVFRVTPLLRDAAVETDLSDMFVLFP